MCRLWLRVGGELRFSPCPWGQAGRVWWVSGGRPGGASLCPPAWSKDAGHWNRMGQGTGPPGISWPHSQGQVWLPSLLAKLSPSPREGSEPGERPSLHRRLLLTKCVASPPRPGVTSKAGCEESGTSTVSLPPTGPEMLLPSSSPTPPPPTQDATAGAFQAPQLRHLRVHGAWPQSQQTWSLLFSRHPQPPACPVHHRPGSGASTGLRPPSSNTTKKSTLVTGETGPELRSPAPGTGTPTWKEPPGWDAWAQRLPGGAELTSCGKATWKRSRCSWGDSPAP